MHHHHHQNGTKKKINKIELTFGLKKQNEKKIEFKERENLMKLIVLNSIEYLNVLFIYFFFFLVHLPHHHLWIQHQRLPLLLKWLLM